MMSKVCSPRLRARSSLKEVLPKHLILPKSTLNQCTTILFHLPEPPNENCYFTAAVTSLNRSYQAEFFVHPCDGVVGGPNGTSSLALHFTPMEYCTLTYELIVTLHPPLGKQVYVVKVAGSCIPNAESKASQQEAACLEALTAEINAKPSKSSSKHQQKRNVKRNPQNNDEFLKESNLLTPAGLLKFLSKKQPDSMSVRGSEHLFNKEQQRKEFEKIQSVFFQELNADEAKEKALAADYRKTRIGQDAVDGESIRRVQQEFQEHSLAYEAFKGRNLTELLSLTRPRYTYQRILQDLEESGYNEAATDLDLKQANQLALASPNSAILKPFVQAAYKIMLRYRVDKRIPAIRSLVQSGKAKI